MVSHYSEKKSTVTARKSKRTAPEKFVGGINPRTVQMTPFQKSVLCQFFAVKRTPTKAQEAQLQTLVGCDLYPGKVRNWFINQKRLTKRPGGEAKNTPEVALPADKLAEIAKVLIPPVPEGKEDGAVTADEVMVLVRFQLECKAAMRARRRREKE